MAWFWLCMARYFRTGRDNFDVFLPVNCVINLHAKVFCLLDYFKLVANFQMEVCILTFEDCSLLGGKIKSLCT